MPADNAVDVHAITLSYNPQLWLKFCNLHVRCSILCCLRHGQCRKNLIFFLYQWMYQYRCADQQTSRSLRNRQNMMQTGISYLVHVSSMTLYSRWSWSEAGSSSSTSALSLCKASERFSSGEIDRRRFGAWRCCSDFGSFRLTRSWKAGLAIGSGTL